MGDKPSNFCSRESLEIWTIPSSFCRKHEFSACLTHILFEYTFSWLCPLMEPISRFFWKMTSSFDFDRRRGPNPSNKSFWSIAYSAFASFLVKLSITQNDDMFSHCFSKKKWWLCDTRVMQPHQCPRQVWVKWQPVRGRSSKFEHSVRILCQFYPWSRVTRQIDAGIVWSCWGHLPTFWSAHGILHMHLDILFNFKVLTCVFWNFHYFETKMKLGSVCRT